MKQTMRYSIGRAARRFQAAWIAAAILAGSVLARAEGDPGFSHKAYDAVLKEFVRADGGVDYKGLRERRAPLDEYIKSLGQVPRARLEAWPKAEQLAFFINAYNSITLKRIIDHYPPKGSGWFYPEISIRNISGVWDKLTETVAGEPVTLDEIEHKIIRARFHEPRAHAAVVCASRSCPPLRAEAYTGGKLEQQLEDQSQRFAADVTKNRIDPKSGIVQISKIFDWFEDDFAAYAAELPPGVPDRMKGGLGFIAHYAPASSADFIKTGKYRVKAMSYDWALNETH